MPGGIELPKQSSNESAVSSQGSSKDLTSSQDSHRSSGEVDPVLAALLAESEALSAERAAISAKRTALQKSAAEHGRSAAEHGRKADAHGAKAAQHLKNAQAGFAKVAAMDAEDAARRKETSDYISNGFSSKVGKGATKPAAVKKSGLFACLSR